MDDISLLTEFIVEATRTIYIPTGEDMAAKKSEIKYGAKPTDTRTHADAQFEQKAMELSATIEYGTLEMFMTSKMENDEFEFSTLDLMALALGIYRREHPKMRPNDPYAMRDVRNMIKEIKQDLINMGFEFKPREPPKHVRGVGSPVHGSSMYAGNYGGSGMGTGFGGPVGIGIGGGPGALGGGYSWDANDKRNLPMGSKKR